jgi:hypothetical protein
MWIRKTLILVLASKGQRRFDIGNDVGEGDEGAMYLWGGSVSADREAAFCACLSLYVVPEGVWGGVCYECYD